MTVIIDRETPLTLAAIVGDILSALVDAQAQAARTTVEYIDSVGFRREAAGSPATLRTVEFNYQKLDENQNASSFRAQIPLLAMVDIPLICVKRATLKLDYEVSNVEPVPAVGVDGKPTSVPKLKGRVLSGRTPSERATIALSVEIEKAEMPPGLSRALDILELAASESKVP